MTDFSVKVHRREGEVVLAACDSDILGKTLVEGGLEVTVKHGFYGGDLLTAEQTFSLADEATIINLLGDRVVEEAVRRGLLADGGVLKVAGIKHAQIIDYIL